MMLSSPSGAAIPAAAASAASSAASDPPASLQHEERAQERQDTAADHDADNMSPDERAYHERFMREAISMVNHPLSLDSRSQGLC